MIQIEKSKLADSSQSVVNDNPDETIQMAQNPSTELFLSYLCHKAAYANAFEPEAVNSFQCWTFLEFCYLGYRSIDYEVFAYKVYENRLDQLPDSAFME